jgi:hypothetical protein
MHYLTDAKNAHVTFEGNSGKISKCPIVIYLRES